MEKERERGRDLRTIYRECRAHNLDLDDRAVCVCEC